MRSTHAAVLLGLAIAASAAAFAQQVDYVYDALGRLTVVQAPRVRATVYSYDAADNRSTVASHSLIFNGTSGDDGLFSSDFTDQINALAGNDTIYSSIGGDTIEGGEGWDTVFWGSQANHTFTWVNPRTVLVGYTPLQTTETVRDTELARFYDPNPDKLFPISWLLTPHATISGTSGADTRNGNPTGVDRISTGAGNDNIAGYGGTDVIDGGADWDTAFYAWSFCDYSFKSVTISETTPLSGVLVKYDPTGETELLINVEGTYFNGTATWMNVSDLIANAC